MFKLNCIERTDRCSHQVLHRAPARTPATTILTTNNNSYHAPKVRSLYALRPTAEDKATLADFEGELESLGKVEQFFIAIADVPRYDSRLECFIFKMRFNREVRSTTNEPGKRPPGGFWREEGVAGPFAPLKLPRSCRGFLSRTSCAHPCSSLYFHPMNACCQHPAMVLPLTLARSSSLLPSGHRSRSSRSR